VTIEVETEGAEAFEQVPERLHEPNPGPLLTIPEVASRLRISRNLAYELAARGELPHIRLGRVIRVPRDALEDWIAASTVPGTSAEHSVPGLRRAA